MTGYTVIGNTAITDIVQQYDRQLIFTQNSAFYSYCEIKTSQTGQAYASFPVYPLNPVKGNYLTGSACTVNGMPVTLCDDGLNIWESTEVESQKNAVCFSDAIKSLILSYAQAGNTTIKLFSDIQSGRLIVSMTRLMYIYDTRRRCWYKLEGITALRFCSGFGRMYIAANDGKIYRLSDTIKDFDAFYTTHYSDFGSCGLKNIKDITLTLKAGEATAGSITAVWTNGGRKQSRSVCFSVSEAINGSVVKVRIPLYIPLADGLTFTFACPSGKDLTLLGYEVATTEKGELPYGL